MYNTTSNSAGQNSSGHSVPDRLVGTERFIKLEQESKAPKVGPDGPFYKADSPELAKWVETGGNVGLNLGDLVALDIDSQEFRQLADSELPETFSIRSGSGGEHRYFRSEWSGRRQFSQDGEDMGSVRSGNWYLVIPPSIHPETGEQYQVLRDNPITPVPTVQLRAFLKEASSQYGVGTANTGGGGGGGGGGGVGCSSVPDVPNRYPNKDANRQSVNRWLDSNGLKSKLKYTAKDRSAQEFAIAKCLAEAGFSESTITSTLDRLPRSSKWHERDGRKDDYQKRTVRKAVVAACNDDFVSFGSPDDSGERDNLDDMTASAVESRKTESGDGSAGSHGGDSNMSSNSPDFDYTSKESVTVYKADSPTEADDGDRVIKAQVTNMNGQDEDGERVDTDFVTVTKGTLRDNGEFGVTPEYPQDNKSVGSAKPEDLRLIAQALSEMADEIEE